MSPIVQQAPDVAGVRDLLEAADLPTEDLAALDMGHFLSLGDRARPHGVVGLEIYGEVALLRSLVVDPERRGTGEGKTLVAAAEQHARAAGVTRMFLLTTTAAPFFARLGYADAPRDTAPAAIRGTREFSSLCPSTARFMARDL